MLLWGPALGSISVATEIDLEGRKEALREISRNFRETFVMGALEGLPSGAHYLEPRPRGAGIFAKLLKHLLKNGCF